MTMTRPLTRFAARLSMLAASTFSLTAPDVARAAWEAVPDVGVFVGTQDNVLLTQADPKSVAGLNADLGVDLRRLTERGMLLFSPRITADSYPDKDAKPYETVDKYLKARGNHNWQRVSIGFQSYYSDESFITSEFSAATPSDPNLDPGTDITDTDPTTGRVSFIDNKRKRLNYGGNLDFQFTQRNRFRFDLVRQDVSYTGTPTADHRDFDNTTAGVTLTRNLDRRNTVSARLAVSEFSAPSNDNTTRSVDLQGSFTRPLSQTWNLNLSAGVERSEYDYVGAGQVRVKNATTSPQFTLGFRKRAERSQWNIDFANVTQAGANGYVATRNEIRMYLDRNFSQRWSGRFGGRFSRLSTLDDVAAQDDRKYYSVEIEADHALKETLFLSFGYNRRYQNFVKDAGRAGSSNQVFVGVSYRGRSRQAR